MQRTRRLRLEKRAGDALERAFGVGTAEGLALSRRLSGR